MHKSMTMVQTWRRIMKALITALRCLPARPSLRPPTVRPVAATAGDQAPPAMVNNAAWARTSGSSPRDGSTMRPAGAGRIVENSCTVITSPPPAFCRETWRDKAGRPTAAAQAAAGKMQYGWGRSTSATGVFASGRQRTSTALPSISISHCILSLRQLLAPPRQDT